MDTKTFLRKLDRIEDLPTLPAIAMEANKMLQNYETSIKDLSDRIENDQAIVSKILKLVNSAFFGVRSKVSNIPHAVILLGFNAVRNAVVSVSVMDAFSMKGNLNGFDITDFWRHSVAVAVTSKYLAEKTHLRSADDAFIGGLLHDIGKIVLVQHFRESFERICRLIHSDGVPFHEAEKTETPVDHARIGGYLANKWQLPAGLVDAIRFHHSGTRNASDPEFGMLVHAGNIVVNTFADDSRKKIRSSEVSPEVMKAMGAQLNDAADWFPEVSEAIGSACDFFLEDSKR